MSENNENIQNKQNEIKEVLESTISLLNEKNYPEATNKLTENIKKFDEYWKENDLNLEVVGEIEAKNKLMIENLSQEEKDPNALEYLHEILFTQLNFLLKKI